MVSVNSFAVAFLRLSCLVEFQKYSMHNKLARKRASIIKHRIEVATCGFFSSYWETFGLAIKF